LRDTPGFSFADAAAQSPDLQACRANPGTRSRAIATGRHFHHERIHVIRDGQGPTRPLRDSRHGCFTLPAGLRPHRRHVLPELIRPSPRILGLGTTGPSPNRYAALSCFAKDRPVPLRYAVLLR